MAGVLHGKLETAARTLDEPEDTPLPPRKPAKRREHVDRPRGSTPPTA